MSPCKPFVSIFIPSYNDQTDLSACLGSLRRVKYPKQKLELVVWDNGSTDETVPMVEQRFREMAGEGWASLRLIQNRKNDGCYVPYNLAMPLLSPQAHYILGLDADIELDPDALPRLVDAMGGERVVVAGARSVVFRDPLQTAHGAGFVSRWTAKYSERDASEQVECDYVIGCCWLFDKRVFEDMGGFSPDFFINHWEVDYCLRAKVRGWRIMYEPRAVAKHKVQYPTACSTERLYYMFRNKLLMIQGNRYFPCRSLTTVLCFLLSVGRIVSIAIRERTLRNVVKACEGLCDGLRGVRGALPEDAKADSREVGLPV
jgi:GT2 family glycosyltransferase